MKRLVRNLSIFSERSKFKSQLHRRNPERSSIHRRPCLQPILDVPVRLDVWFKQWRHVFGKWWHKKQDLWISRYLKITGKDHNPSGLDILMSSSAKRKIQLCNFI